MENTKTTQPSRRAAVYRLYDADGALLYIGSAYDPDHRCKAHQRQPWWPDVARRTEEWFDHRTTAYAEELKAIAVERSKYNVMGTPQYQTPKSDPILRRNALAVLRGRLIRAAGDVSLDIYAAARDAGYSYWEAQCAGAMAEIEFLERTGLFAASVRRRRQQIEKGLAAGPNKAKKKPAEPPKEEGSDG